MIFKVRIKAIVFSQKKNYYDSMDFLYERG
nr:MAG TPA: hypothetical protein [Caudoviricetes sp.]DAS02850.1 MAG TPA: hypothetical protein [Caudoviricetes sp.]